MAIKMFSFFAVNFIKSASQKLKFYPRFAFRVDGFDTLASFFVS